MIAGTGAARTPPPRGQRFRRLVLPAGMGALLLLSLAYWWQDNLVHEVAGTAFLAVAAWHIVQHRVWFTHLARGRFGPRRAAGTALNLLLATNMAVLLVTSIVISQSVFSFLPPRNSIALREVHWFSAYWAMLVVGLHLGLQWTRVMAAMRNVLGLPGPDRRRTVMLRIASAALAACGAWSFSVLDIWKKLTFTYSLDFWDFTASVTPFFGHWLSVTALPAIATHYALTWHRHRRSRRMPRRHDQRL